MKIDPYFNQFIKLIQPQPSQELGYYSAIEKLKSNFNKDTELSKYKLDIFEHGSHGRKTAIRPIGDKGSDIDLMVVTNLNKNDFPDAESLFSMYRPFFKKHYSQKEITFRTQTRSFGINLHHCHIDVVIGIAENKNSWRDSPIWIPDREDNKWIQTNPIYYNNWLKDKKQKTNGHFLHVVQVIKYWQILNSQEIPRPKGFKLDRLIAEACPEGIASIADGVVNTLEKIKSNFSELPELPLYGVKNTNVFSSISVAEYSKFYKKICDFHNLVKVSKDHDKNIELAIKDWKKIFPNFPDKVVS